MKYIRKFSDAASMIAAEKETEHEMCYLFKDAYEKVNIVNHNNPFKTCFHYGDTSVIAESVPLPPYDEDFEEYAQYSGIDNYQSLTECHIGLNNIDSSLFGAFYFCTSLINVTIPNGIT